MKGIRNYLGHGMIWSFILVNIIILSRFITELIKNKITEDNLGIAIVYILTGIIAFIGYKYVLPRSKSFPKSPSKMLKINFEKVFIIIFFVILGFFVKIFVFSDNAYGRYIPYLNVAILEYENLTYWQTESLNAHEYGHYVWYEVLNQSMRDEFIIISLKYKFDNATNCYWGYDNLETEDFADTYKYYRLNPTKLSLCKDKLKFMNEVNKVEYNLNYD